jgi:hypothetical protein
MKVAEDGLRWITAPAAWAMPRCLCSKRPSDLSAIHRAQAG